MAISLKAARVNAGMTQTAAAAEYNTRFGQRLATSTLVSWEQGKTWPTAQQFRDLCDVYGVSMDDIFIPETLLIK